MIIPRSSIEWDHEWMALNWQRYDDEVIAHRFMVTTSTVRGYRQRKGWKREHQRYRGGSKSNSEIMTAIAKAIAKGIDINLRPWQLGEKIHVTIQAHVRSAGIKSEVHILPSLNCLPRIMKELEGELESRKKAA